MNGLALCAGAGGLELGLYLAEPGYRTVGWVEREARAAAALVARMADAAVGDAPVWDDVATFDGGRWRGCVDIVSAGFPCQPFSVAGLQRGVADERHLWPAIAGIIGGVCPEWVLLENVPGLATTIAPDGRSALETVHDDLREMGYEVAWDEFSAAEVGASHLRERLFIVAHAEHPQRRAELGKHGDSHRRNGSGRGCSPVAHATSRGLGGDGGAPRHTGHPERSGGPVGDTGGPRHQGGLLARRADAARREEPDGPSGQPGCVLPAFPPGRNEYDRWRAILAEYPDLAPALEPGLHGVADGMADRLDRSRLALTGNGVVPLVAAHAWLTLRARLEWR